MHIDVGPQYWLKLRPNPTLEAISEVLMPEITQMHPPPPQPEQTWLKVTFSPTVFTLSIAQILCGHPI
jgi:hypothetical protein